MPRQFRILTWFGVGTTGILLLAFAVAQVPVDFRPVGLYLILFSLLGGWLLGRFAQWCRLPARLWVAIASALILGGGQVGLLGISYCVYAREVERHFQALAEAQKAGPTATRLAESQREEPEDFDPEAAAKRQQFRDELDRSEAVRYKRLVERKTFSAYLSHRISPLRLESAPWPVIFVVGEILCGGMAGGWVTWRELQPESTSGAFPSSPPERL